MKDKKRMMYSYTHFNFFAVLLTVLTISGCETTIPEPDTQLPEIRLTITGPGIGRQEMTNPPRDEWAAPRGTQLFNLEAGRVYQFTLLVSDQGGVARANLRMPDNFSVTDLTSPDITEEIVGISRSLTIRGSRANPLTGLGIGGKFRTPSIPNNFISFTFDVEADDFGGASGRRPNQRFMKVNAAVNAP